MDTEEEGQGRGESRRWSGAAAHFDCFLSPRAGRRPFPVRLRLHTPGRRLCLPLLTPPGVDLECGATAAASPCAHCDTRRLRHVLILTSPLIDSSCAPSVQQHAASNGGRDEDLLREAGQVVRTTRETRRCSHSLDMSQPLQPLHSGAEFPCCPSLILIRVPLSLFRSIGRNIKLLIDRPDGVRAAAQRPHCLPSDSCLAVC